LFAFKYTFLLVAVLGLAASAVRAAPRIAETFVIDAPADFRIRGPEDLRRLEEFPARRVTSIDDPGPAVGRPDWFKLRLERTDTDDVSRLFLRFNAATQRRITSHLVEKGAVRSQAEAGYSLDSDSRTHQTVRLILSLQAWEGREALVYVRSDRDHRLPLEPRFLKQAEWEQDSASDVALLSAYLSGAFFILIVQVILYFHFRERAVRDYILVTLTFVAIALVRSGYFDFLFADGTESFRLGDWGGQIRLINTLMIGRSFRSFFDLREVAPRLHAWLGFFQYILVASLAASFFAPVAIMAFIAPLFYVIMAGTALVACFVAVRAGLVGARLISAGWAGIALLSLIVNLSSLGWIPNVVPNPASWFYFAAFWELLCNTLGLTYKFRTWEKISHQKELRDLEAAGLERMVRVLCHDVSTPLATIGMTTDLVELNQQAGRPVDLAATNRRLREAFLAIKEIVDSARNVELVKLHGGVLPREPVDLCAVFADAERMMKEKLARKRISVRGVALPEKALVLAEPRLLRLSVIANALSNAIKFSRPETTIDAEIGHKGRDVILRIRDHGVGIPAEMRETFARSGRINSRPGTMNEEGTGFGVLLMRDFTQAMGGSFRLESRTNEESPSDHGTTVEIILRAPGAA